MSRAKTIQFGKYIKRERLLKLITQSQLAEELGISQSALSKIESDKIIPDANTWYVFCIKFNLDPSSILAEMDVKI